MSIFQKDCRKCDEVCQKATQSLETIIWQTSGIMGIGLIGTLFLAANRAEKDQPPWWGALVIGFSVFLVSGIWWFIARRWWSIQHSFFIRMRHIEEELDIYATRYLHYLDNPDLLCESGLSKPRKKELKKGHSRDSLSLKYISVVVYRIISGFFLYSFFLFGLYILCCWPS